MYDLPPDIPRLRILETWLLVSLERVRQQIAAVEQVEAMESARRAPAPPPPWSLEVDRARQPTAVHVGDCTMGGERGRPLTRDAALRALAVDQVPPCEFCRPDAALGVLD